MELEIVNKLFLELSQFATAQTSRELIAIQALEQLAKLGNGEHYGNSEGNTLALFYLGKIKRVAE